MLKILLLGDLHEQAQVEVVNAEPHPSSALSKRIIFGGGQVECLLELESKLLRQGVKWSC